MPLIEFQASHFDLPSKLNMLGRSMFTSPTVPCLKNLSATRERRGRARVSHARARRRRGRLRASRTRVQFLFRRRLLAGRPLVHEIALRLELLLELAQRGRGRVGRRRRSRVRRFDDPRHRLDGPTKMF